jgi:hypothetical protein
MSDADIVIAQDLALLVSDAVFFATWIGLGLGVVVGFVLARLWSAWRDRRSTALKYPRLVPSRMVKARRSHNPDVL